MHQGQGQKRVVPAAAEPELSVWGMNEYEIVLDTGTKD